MWINAIIYLQYDFFTDQATGQNGMAKVAKKFKVGGKKISESFSSKSSELKDYYYEKLRGNIFTNII